MTKSKMLLMRATRFALAIATGIVTTQALASGLRVTATSNALPASAAVAGAFGFSLVNEGMTTFDSVRLVADPGHAVACADLTAQNRSFAIGGLLGAGDRVTCTTQPVAGGHNVAGVSVIASGGSAPPQVRHVTFTRRPMATPNQGIVVLAAGASLQDTNADGNLDAGEAIAYNYSVVNLGTLALSGLAVTDNDGTVACPQTTLAVGANMVCLSNHAINATEAGAGLVANQVDISGTDGTDPVAGGDFIVTYNLGGTAGIRLFKSPLLFDDADSSGYASTGDVLRYTFVVKNSNAQDLSAVNVIEPDPSRIDPPITCAATTLGGHAFAGLGSGVLLSNDVVLCTANYTIAPTDAASGSADNLAESSGQPAIGTLASGAGASAVVIPAADLTIVKTHTGTFVRGQAGGSFSLLVTNIGTGATSGLVSVVDTLPTGLIANSIGGAGWNCVLPTLTCTRSDVLLPGNSYPIITISVTVAADAPALILNTVVVSGGGDFNLGNNDDDDAVPVYDGIPTDVIPVPVDAHWAMLLMIGLILVLARRKVKAGRF